MKNKFEKDYKMFMALNTEENYYKEIGDKEKLEESQKRMHEFMDEINTNKVYEELFGMYVKSRENENELLNIIDFGGVHHVESAVNVLKANGIEEFTFSGIGRVADIAWHLNELGYELKGLVRVNSDWNPIGDGFDYDTVPAFLFSKKGA